MRQPVALGATGAAPRGIRRAALACAAVLALATLALAPRAEAYVYWIGGDGGSATIGRATLDGSGVQRNFIVLPFGGGRCGVAVDDAHLYWANTATEAPTGAPLAGSIGRANLDGTGVDQNFIAEINPSFPCGVAVDGSHLYWTNAGTIGRANLDGSGVDESFVGGVNNPCGLAVDAAHLYWASLPVDFDPITGGGQGGGIGRANLDGTGVDTSFISGLACGLAVDAAHLYWADQGKVTDEFPPISRANLDGTGVESLVGDANACGGGGVAVDDTHVYWAAGGSIGRANLDGSRANRKFITGAGDSCGGVAVNALRSFSFGKAKTNKRKGTAKLTVNVPGPGELELAKTEKVKGAEERAEGTGKVKLPIKSRGKAKNKLTEKGKVNVKATVTYTPDGGEPNTESKRIKLVKR